MTRQVSTKSVTLSSVVRAPAFRQGFKDAMAGKRPAFDHDWPADARKSSTDKAWAYERGRLFAAYCRGEGIQLDPKAWFVDRRLSRRVLNAAADALRSGAIR